MKTVCLNMIVKNESANILRCLQSVVSYISAWVICDTGSTDGTQEIIKEFFEKCRIPGELHEFEFVDFAQARNQALDAAQTANLDFDYILFADADMELISSPFAFAALTAECYSLRQDNVIAYWNTRLIRRYTDATYVGVTHEYMKTTAWPVQLAGAHFIDHADGANRGDKFARDILLLANGLKNEPDNARYAFYLAQSQMDAGQLDGAIAAYKYRITLGGFDEEVFYSMLKIASMSERLGKDPVGEYLDAYSFRPTRAEPLVELARWHREKSEYSTALLYARAAAQIKYPADHLFVDIASHTWKPWDEIAISAWYCGAHEEGKAASDKLLKDKKYPASEYARIVKNYQFYSPAVTEAA